MAVKALLLLGAVFSGVFYTPDAFAQAQPQAVDMSNLQVPFVTLAPEAPTHGVAPRRGVLPGLGLAVPIAQVYGIFPPDTLMLVVPASDTTYAYHAGMLVARRLVNGGNGPTPYTLLWDAPSGLVALWLAKQKQVRHNHFETQNFRPTGLRFLQTPVLADNLYESPWAPVLAQAIGGQAAGQDLPLAPFYLARLDAVYAHTPKAQVFVPDERERSRLSLPTVDSLTLHADTPLHYVFLYEHPQGVQVFTLPLALVYARAPAEQVVPVAGGRLAFRIRTTPTGRIDVRAPMGGTVRQMLLGHHAVTQIYPDATPLTFP
jgi:hypothetical protein